MTQRLRFQSFFSERSFPFQSNFFLQTLHKTSVLSLIIFSSLLLNRAANDLFPQRPLPSYYIIFLRGSFVVLPPIQKILLVPCRSPLSTSKLLSTDTFFFTAVISDKICVKFLTTLGTLSRAPFLRPAAKYVFFLPT